MHLDVLFTSQLVGFFSRLQRSRDLVWLDSPGSPAQAGFQFLVAVPTVGFALLNGNGIMVIPACGLTLPPWVTQGQRQHVVRDAWRAWCLRRHMGVGPVCDTQLDCSDAGGYFRRIDWHATIDCLRRRAPLLVRWFAVLLFRQLLSVVRSLFTLPPPAFGTTAPNLGRLIMLLGNVSIVPRFVPKPAEFLSSRYGWVVMNQNVDITLVQSWLIEVQQSICTAVYQ